MCNWYFSHIMLTTLILKAIPSPSSGIAIFGVALLAFLLFCPASFADTRVMPIVRGRHWCSILKASESTVGRSGMEITTLGNFRG